MHHLFPVGVGAGIAFAVLSPVQLLLGVLLLCLIVAAGLLLALSWESGPDAAEPRYHQRG